MTGRLHYQNIWVAVTPRGRVVATWYRGCVQPFKKWRAAVISLGHTPEKAILVRRRKL